MPSLLKEDGPQKVTARRVTVVGTWETSTGGDSGWRGKVKKINGVNLDNVGIVVQGTRPVNYAGLDNLNPEPGIDHSGDDKKGKNPETLTITLADVPREITAILFSMAAFQEGTSFRDAKNVRVTVQADEDYTIRPSIVGNATFIGVAKLYREGLDWYLTVVDEARQIAQGNRDALVNAATGM